MAGALLSVAALAGCQSSIDGTATREPDTTFTEPEFPTPRPTRPDRKSVV